MLLAAAALRPRERAVGLVGAGAVGVYTGLVLYPVLIYGLVLTAAPAAVERAGTLIAVCAGVAAATVGLRPDD